MVARGCETARGLTRARSSDGLDDRRLTATCSSVRCEDAPTTPPQGLATRVPSPSLIALVLGLTLPMPGRANPVGAEPRSDLLSRATALVWAAQSRLQAPGGWKDVAAARALVTTAGPLVELAKRRAGSKAQGLPTRLAELSTRIQVLEDLHRALGRASEKWPEPAPQIPSLFVRLEPQEKESARPYLRVAVQRERGQRRVLRLLQRADVLGVSAGILSVLLASEAHEGQPAGVALGRGLLDSAKRALATLVVLNHAFEFARPLLPDLRFRDVEVEQALAEPLGAMLAASTDPGPGADALRAAYAAARAAASASPRKAERDAGALLEALTDVLERSPAHPLRELLRQSGSATADQAWEVALRDLLREAASWRTQLGVRKGRRGAHDT